MKRFLVILVLIVMLFSVCACSNIPSTRFMSRTKVNSLVKKYGTPQAELTINYTINNKNYEIKVTYDLLLSQAPLSVVRFIQLANEGFYDESVVDTYNSTYNYMILGRYSYKDSTVNNGKSFYVNQSATSDVTFKGEFASNEYREPSEGYAQFSIFSLAMYHDEYKNENETNFDSANGALILATSNKTLNSNNYAVFATMTEMSYKVGDSDPVENKKVIADALANLVSFTSKTSTRKIYTDSTEQTTIPSFSMMNQIVTIHVKILGDYDWSKLPQIG